MKITKLSEYQQDLLTETSKEALEDFISLGNEDCQKAELLISQLYELVGYKPPEKFLWVDSPVAFSLLNMRCQYTLDNPSIFLGLSILILKIHQSKIYKKIKLQYPQIIEFVEKSKLVRRDTLLGTDLLTLDILELDAALDFIYTAKEPSSKFHKYLQKNFSDSVLSKIVEGSHLSVYALKKSLFATSIYSVLGQKVSDAAFDFEMNRFFFNTDLSSSFYSYKYYNTILEEKNNLACFSELNKHCDLWIPRKNICLISRKPIYLGVKTREELDNRTGLVARYRDGTESWAIKGVPAPKELALNPQNQTIKDILIERNVELKRIRIELYGWEQFLKETKAKIIDSQSIKCNEGTFWLESLYHLKKEKMTILVTYDPSTGRPFALEVPLHIISCSQAQEYLLSSRIAIEGTGFDFNIKTYPKIRT